LQIALTFDILVETTAKDGSTYGLLLAVPEDS